ncbi:MAG: hypothetical protein HY036_05395 [Nitrospirae bacterium]|nr:hypothetical protein [Nitrospirota bacterium]MBI3351996.1 hypothetical protein [Nitrospirota bacterium]
MFKKIKEDSELGVQIVKNRLQNLIHRSVEEIDAIKVRLEIRKLEKEIDELMLQAGKVLFEKLQKGETCIEETELTALFSKAVQMKEEQDLLKNELTERLNPSQT